MKNPLTRNAAHGRKFPVLSCAPIGRREEFPGSGTDPGSTGVAEIARTSGGPVLLSSAVIVCEHFAPVLANLARGLVSAAVVTTAQPKLKERCLNASLARSTLLAAGFSRVEFYDLDFAGGEKLRDFDCVYLACGNPYYLMRRLRETEADTVLEEMGQARRPLIGSGAGAMVLGRSLRMLSFFDTTVPDLGWKDRTGLNLLSFSVLPSADRWRARFSDYHERVGLAEAACECPIEELDRTEGLLVNRHGLSLVGGEQWPGATRAAG